MGAMFSLPSIAQDLHSGTPEIPRTSWMLSATASEESIGQGLPVLALDRDDWPRYRSGQSSQPRAWRSLQAELSATHPGGWRFGALARAEAWLQASPDAVTVAALDAINSRPETARSYDLNASSQSWQGQGLRVGTPWLKLDAADRWRWQADAQLLRLQKFRTVDLSGKLSYQSSDVYDFNVHSQRSNPNITGPYLSASGRSGLGSSLSVAVQGEPAAGWQVQLRADDLLSRLDWPELATDNAVLNSQVTSRAPDGSLDYAPLIKGQKTLRHITRRIGVHWQAKVSWSAFGPQSQPGAISLQLDRRAGLNQAWLGWDSGDAGRSRPRWSLAIEPVRRVASLGLGWHGWQALLATDGKGTNSEFRYLRLGWQGEF
ncbi:hypothetical protein [Polaromonas naphthalenivorans]|nr:hypothetical protein [Polaromonas naphthalenivorans]